MYDLCVGLGYHCESTHQIRRITGEDRAHYFDWLDLELASVIETLEADFANVLRPGLSEPFSDGACALDRGSDIRFFHEFRADADAPGGLLTQDAIDRQLPRVRAKFDFLAERWRATSASAARVLYVHHDAFDESDTDDLLRLRAALSRSHPGHRFGLLWLRRTPPPPRSAARLPDGIRWDTVEPVPGRWEGDDAGWDRALAPFPLRRRAPAPGTAGARPAA
ncbi:papain-like cysteine peptidase [Streptomyces sp. NPDC052077]|uniref:papain-like cysteine peptidase n=1 Tax=Streptomyces sp. NPDC052077 TaxID=3154757 RepID=UPI0034324C2B